MNLSHQLRTSESVSAGHPDKVCDQISDAIVDACLNQNPFAHTAIETFATTNRVIVAGEVKGVTLLKHDIDSIVRKVIQNIGYTQDGFHYDQAIVESYIHEQSDDISLGVGNATETDAGAGDQGIMFGYACDETDVYMPAPIHYAHQILQNLRAHQRSDLASYLGPDAKSQITLRYEDERPVGVETIVLSTQHHPDVTVDNVRRIVEPIIKKTLPEIWQNNIGAIYINPTGRFVIGGPDGDTGLTGRKIIVDTYGGAAPHGGGAFSGKDPTKVDRSAAYMLRYIAKNLVAAGLCKRCTIQVAYVIGHAQPVSLWVNTHQTSVIPDQTLTLNIRQHFDLSPIGIRKFLNLNRPIYQETASYGHFGRPHNLETNTFSWESLDSINIIKSW